MPDIRLDYPEQYEKWEQYLRDFDFDKPTPKLPAINSEKEKFFNWRTEGAEPIRSPAFC